MRNIIYVLLALAIALSACKKDKNAPKQYSTWSVNGQEFKTNEVNTTIGKVTAIINSYGEANRFSLTFNVGYLPSDGVFIINCSQQNPAWCCWSLYYDGKGYYTPDDAYITARKLSNKTSYILDSTWMFDRLIDPSDSILVYGTFNEP